MQVRYIPKQPEELVFSFAEHPIFDSEKTAFISNRGSVFSESNLGSSSSEKFQFFKLFGYIKNDSFIDVWAINSQKYLQEKNVLYGFLDTKEREKSARFKFDNLRDNYIIFHGFLRYFISQYISISPNEVSFCFGPFGKPFLSRNPIYFNMSHSHDMALYAFSNYGEVGVDIEYTMKHSDTAVEVPFLALPRRDRDEILSLPLEERRGCFFKKWTRMEAGFKAIGIGLQDDVENGSLQCIDFNFYDIELPEGYVGALASPV